MAPSSPPTERPTPTELAILLAIYALGSASPTDLNALPQFKDRAYTTIQTLCARLREKRYLDASRFGRDILFTPALPLEGVLRPEIEEFFASVLDNSPQGYQLLLEMVGERLKRIASPQQLPVAAKA